MEAVAEREGISKNNDMLNDKAAGIYSAFFSLGAIIAPIIGGILDDHVGYRSTNDIMAIISLVFFFIYLVTNTKPEDYKILPKKIEKEDKESSSIKQTESQIDSLEKNSMSEIDLRLSIKLLQSRQSELKINKSQFASSIDYTSANVG
jgi:MFS family permease